MSSWNDHNDANDDDGPEYSGLTDWSRAERDAREGLELADRSHGPRTHDQLRLAVQLLRRAIELVPTDPTWHLALASSLESLGELPAAVDAYHAAHDLDPQNLQTTLAWATALHRSARYRETLSVLASLQESHPAFEPAYCLKIETLSELRRFPAAEEAYYTARLYEDHCPRCDLAMARALLAQNQPNLNFARRALQLLSRLEESNQLPGHEPLLAQAALACGHYDRATTLLQSLLHDQPDNPSLWTQLGTAHHLALRHSEALDAFTRAAELAPPDSPDSAPAHAALARFLLSRNQPTPALAAANAALRADPTLPGLHLLIARAALDARLPTQARHHLRRELQILSDADPASMLEVALLLDRARRPTLALRVLQRLVQIAPDSIGAWQNIAVLSFRLRRFDDGLAASYHALRLSPHHPDTLYNLALAHARRKAPPHLSAALSYARLATLAAPHDPAPPLLLTRLRLAQLRQKLTALLPNRFRR